MRTTYADGGQNAIFAALLKKGANLGTVSRPEALAYAGIDVTLVPARHHKAPEPLTVAKADWIPEPRLATSETLKTHPGPVPAAIDQTALGSHPMHYALYKPPQVPALIAGAMPMRLATWTN